MESCSMGIADGDRDLTDFAVRAAKRTLFLRLLFFKRITAFHGWLDPPKPQCRFFEIFKEVYQTCIQ
jgi:hypothetical protein